jgi:hypothetical protein
MWYCGESCNSIKFIWSFVKICEMVQQQKGRHDCICLHITWWCQKPPFQHPPPPPEDGLKMLSVQHIQCCYHKACNDINSWLTSNRMHHKNKSIMQLPITLCPVSCHFCILPYNPASLPWNNDKCWRPLLIRDIMCHALVAGYPLLGTTDQFCLQGSSSPRLTLEDGTERLSWSW